MISVKDNLRRSLLCATLSLCAVFALTASASAAPVWEVHSHHEPSLFEPDGKGEYSFFVNNVGDGDPVGPVTIQIELPPGVTTRFGPSFFDEVSVFAPKWDCPAAYDTGADSVTCTSYTDPAKFETGRVLVYVDVPADAAGSLVAQATITNGAETVFASHAAPVGAEPSEFGIVPGSFEVDAFDELGIPERQAGRRPFRAMVGFDLNSALQGDLTSEPVGTIRHVEVSPPFGFAGNPRAVPQCPGEIFRREYQWGPFDASGALCPANTQVGTVQFTIMGAQGPKIASASNTTALYNLVPPKGTLAFFGLLVAGIPTYIRVELDPRDNSVLTRVRQITDYFPVHYQRLTLWGVPGDSRHDEERWNPKTNSYGADFEGPIRPLVSLSTECNVLGTTKLRVTSWQDVVDPPLGHPPYESEPQQLHGCNQLQFEPTIQARPSTNLADAPSGLEFAMHIPQNEDPNGLATSHLRDAVVRLPEGMTVNPPSADGLDACSMEEIGIDASGTPTSFMQSNGVEKATPVNCPDASKLGTVEVETPAVDHPLKGSVYLGEQSRNPFGSLIALYLAIDDPETGVLVKLAGRVDADPATGRLAATFRDNPQLPVEDLRLKFFEGPRAALKTPAACGTHTTKGTLTPWSAPEAPSAQVQSSFNLLAGPGGGACLPGAGQAPNTPAFSAGTVDPTAKAYTPFAMKLTRPDGSQQLQKIDVTLPEGLTGKLAGIPYCPEASLAAAATKAGKAEQAAPSCPLASRVGSVDVGAGAGSTPLYVTGQAYLAGPYKNAPLSLAIITPAVAGPFDLGTVVVRTALNVDRATAQIHAVSDQLPTILEGIPLNIRSIALKMDRPEFVLNPTSCDPMAIAGQALTVFGQAAQLSERFQVGECGRLAFKPKLSLKLTGPTKRSRNPALRAVLKQPLANQANIDRVQVVLPKSAFIDNEHVNNPCTRVQFDQGACPKSSILGTATAWTPLLDQPLHGNVYFRSNGGARDLPDIVATLGGQIQVELVGYIDSVVNKKTKTSRVRNTFAIVPDAPVSKFVMRLKGGKVGLIENSANLCKVKSLAEVKMRAQNGKAHDFAVEVGNDCRKKKPRKGKGGGGKKG